ncbi:MAG: hypothetical protein CMK89_08140 [Pseudomonadales bacterium]|nr:hypothetical protein [Pseudomonadales bacterium]
MGELLHNSQSSAGGTANSLQQCGARLMWALNNKTPFAAERTWGRDLNGWHQWIVAVKATYDILPDGELELAEEQAEPLFAPEYFGEPGLSSLQYEADLIPTKPTTDIIVNGTAYAPGGKPSTEFAVALRANGKQKALRVLGERYWEQGLTGLKPSKPQPVTAVPIRYEKAFGGWDRSNPNPAKQKWDPRNPVGSSLIQNDEQLGKTLHQFEYLEGSPHKTGPAGFGAIDSFWSPRSQHIGTYDKAWQENRHPLLPLDWKPQSLQCAPQDQQTEKPLRGGENIELFNLTPDGQLAFQLPRVYLAFSTQIDGRTEEHRAQISSVIIEPDQRKLKLVWNSVLLCRNEGDYLEQTTIRQKRYEQ